MTAEMVSSAVTGEIVNRIITSLVDKLEGKPNESSTDNINIERLEMAHIRMEAALAMSSKWQITDVPTLRWRRKLKRAAQDCNDALRRSKQRAMEDDQNRQRVSNSPFPKRIAHAAKCLVSSFISSDASRGTLSDVQRFERFADGANEFLKLVEFGGTPRQYMFFNPLIGHLLSGKSVRYKALEGSTFYYLTIRPMSFEGRGVEAYVGFACQDSKETAECITLGLMLRLSESTDVFGVLIKCLQSCLCMPHFKFAADRVKRELVQLPTQDFSVTYPSCYGQSENLINVHSTLTQWCRPNPLCCTDHEHDPITSPMASSSTNALSSFSSSSSSRRRLLSNMFPEQVIVLILQRHISLSDGHHSIGIPPLKLGALFVPHDSPEDIEPAAESYALELIGENEQEVTHSNACLQDINDKLLPEALQYLYQNGSRIYQMCFKSSHGTAHLCMEKATTRKRSARRRRSTAQSRARDNKKIVEQGDDYNIQGWKPVCIDLLKFRVVRASNKLQDSIRSWVSCYVE